MSIAPYLKTIGRGKDGARPLQHDQALDLMQRVLAGQVSDLELGGFALAMRIKGETAIELDAFVAATLPHLLPIAPPPGQTVVLLPSYNGARKLPNLTPLLAALLARDGLPVLVHGPLEDAGRVTSAAIFTALGWAPCADAAAVHAAWQAGRPAFIDIAVLNPPLARLLAVRRVLGLRNSGHTVAKLLPAVAGGLRVINHTHPEYALSLAQYLRDSAADAVLMRGTEGEPVADARRQARMDVYLQGERDEALSLLPQEGALTALPALPEAIDAATTAQHLQALLRGEQPLPPSINAQVNLLKTLCHHLNTRN
jgi:anthranilate phosphoribosyltransferase